jgi:hypothetical protein
MAPANMEHENSVSVLHNVSVHGADNMCNLFILPLLYSDKNNYIVISFRLYNIIQSQFRHQR